jgi:hypothetical protein
MRVSSSITAAYRCRTTSAISGVLILICFVGVAHRLYGQAEPTATRPGNLQIGGTFIQGNSDYATSSFRGFGFYSTFDFRYHLGLETEFHQLNDSNSSQGIYERTYEVGPRFVLHHRRFQPYVRAMGGRGVFNYPAVGNQSTGRFGANLAYNIVAGGTGLDYRFSRSINFRADYEYQYWIGFQPHGLTPTLMNFGAAYHFH